MNIKLNQLDSSLKKFIAVYIIVIIIGLTIGLIYLSQTTSITPKGTIERFSGSEINESEFEIVDSYPKPISEMLITTHNHILGLSFIFFSIGILFYFNTIIKGFWKIFLMIDPLVSLLITFGSIWLVRYIDTQFIYITFLSSIVMYLSFYIMSFVIIFDLILKKK
ncbi:MAG: hypothetical protein FJ214_10435 [Ignavibacteria bacterium]|nr:hypothetical protein [Ignavibacteria bacterium]